MGQSPGSSGFLENPPNLRDFAKPLGSREPPRDYHHSSDVICKKGFLGNNDNKFLSLTNYNFLITKIYLASTSNW